MQEPLLGSTVALVLVTTLLAALVAYIVVRCVYGAKMTTRRRRHTLLLLGPCGSGKTTLFAQLVARKRISARTSMQPNRAVMRFKADAASDDEEGPQTSPGACMTVVDFPGHRRLRCSIDQELEEAKKVVIVVDSVTIQDPQGGAEALAELVVSVFTSPAFYFVEGVLVACTKRDELTSYSAKSVQKLLEKEITHHIITRRGDVQSIGDIVNAEGVAVGRRKNNGSSLGKTAKRHQLSLNDSGKFTFDTFPLPVDFVDISSFPEPEKHPFNVDPVREFASR
ncbi:putative ADP ribosylation factor family Signal recognition particle [Trypanosoma vivax]|uniref:Signal recognition particle receptor subunit beta n=1 Tax=Trypanosoma vivax (strain Y486) TaxID=1055687 RepID=G0TRW9_TRYVY|nr:hypothetical protein TRVL_03763 [Trypanosoma vivax]KAH8617400.1 putative ADP ribosylation factor family Signal recognition particle [Trypanosoma vivax]CCC46692.1 conserved hypothetical protein [Trypanosoma vivax Y486]